MAITTNTYLSGITYNMNGYKVKIISLSFVIESIIAQLEGSNDFTISFDVPTEGINELGSY